MSIPEGWPTDEMLDAARSISGDYGTGLRERIMAALAAAPTPPEAALKKVAQDFLDYFDTQGDIDTIAEQVNLLRDAIEEGESDD